jgi:hypothetical protein
MNEEEGKMQLDEDALGKFTLSCISCALARLTAECLAEVANYHYCL